MTTTIPQGAYLCSICGYPKPEAAFCAARRPDRKRPVNSWCKACANARKAERRRSGAYREAERALRARERDRRCEEGRARYWKNRDAIRARRSGVRSRLVALRSDAIRRYRAADDPARRGALLVRVAAIEAELVRIDADLGVDRGEWSWRPFVAPEWGPRGAPPSVSYNRGAYVAWSMGHRYLGRYPTPAIAAGAVARAAREGRR